MIRISLWMGSAGAITSVFYRETDYGEYNVANYLTNSAWAAALQFGYPISVIHTRIGLNLTYDKTDIDPGTHCLQGKSQTFLASEGTVFDVFKAQAVWSKNDIK